MQKLGISRAKKQNILIRLQILVRLSVSLSFRSVLCSFKIPISSFCLQHTLHRLIIELYAEALERYLALEVPRVREVPSDREVPSFRGT